MASAAYPPGPEVEALRARLAHPIIDGDGHLIESVPLLFEYVGKVGGEALAKRFGAMLGQKTPFTRGDAARGEPRAAWWGTPSRALDIASVTAPGLLAKRLDELGVDFAVLYPSLGLAITTLPDEELRRGVSRALNTMNAEICAEHASRLTPSAVLPMGSPAEAVDELSYAVRELRLKAAAIPPVVARPLEAFPEAFPAACALDRFAVDSAYDYDPVWQAFVDLGVAVTSHGAVAMHYMPDGRRSPSNYVFNHIGGHAYQQSELAKSLIMGGVPLRFPSLRFGFLECGVGWAPDLLHSLEEHWEKRAGKAIEAYDPRKIDHGELKDLLTRHGFAPQAPLGGAGDTSIGPWVRDEFADSAITRKEQLRDMFAHQFFFGCEADDISIYRAFHGRGNPFGIQMQAFFSSDIGHWDVPDMRSVVLESRKLFDRGLLGDEDYRAFAFENPARLHLTMNARFFEGTSVDEATKPLLEQGTRG